MLHDYHACFVVLFPPFERQNKETPTSEVELIWYDSIYNYGKVKKERKSIQALDIKIMDREP